MNQLEIIFLLTIIGSFWFWGYHFIWPQRFWCLFLFSFSWSLIVSFFLLPIWAYLGVCYVISIPFVDKKNARHAKSMNKLKKWVSGIGKYLKRRWKNTFSRGEKAEAYEDAQDDSNDLLEMNAMYEMTKGKKS